MNLKILILFLVLIHEILSLKPSPGCQNFKSYSKEVERIDITYDDKILGLVERNYLIQFSFEYDGKEPLPLVLDLHGWTGSAVDQVEESGWQHLVQTEDLVLVWPDGMADGPSSMGSWNCSNSIGPLGPTCDLNRLAWNQSTECYYSCPLCNAESSCDWTTCYDDIGFIEFIIQDVTNTHCIDMDQMHLSGISNGGMFAYYLASMATDGLGLASINPVAASSLIGYGVPPSRDINFSIIDFHGTQDDNIPYNAHGSFGTGPFDSLISFDGFYYDDKETLLNSWSIAMKCEDREVRYPTPFDGQSGFVCYEKKCARNTAILRCYGNWMHEYPVPGLIEVTSEVAFSFMQLHPRQ